MRRYLGLLLMFLVGALLASCTGPKAEPTQPAGKSAAGPRLAFDQKLVDYGDIGFGEAVGATFHLTNVGDKPLTIEKADLVVKDGC